MTRILSLAAILILAFSLMANGADHKKEVKITRLEEINMQDYQVATRFSSAELCTVRHDSGIVYGIYPWLEGDELYKSYQDPSQSCDLPYPFTVEDVYMVLWFNKASTLLVSVDVETADMTDPSCPAPGDLVSISSLWQVTIPEPPPTEYALYQIGIPLDSPAVVEGPYFAGFYFADTIAVADSIFITTDEYPVPCVSWNIWDTTIGWVDLYDLGDLGSPQFPGFPGRVLLYSSGTTGGSSGEEPVPSVTIIKPADGEDVTGEAVIWAAETAGSRIIDYALFEYRNGSVWHEIGSDYDGSRAIRDGIDSSGSGEGYTMPWDYSGLTEGTYWIRATIYDTLGRSDTDSIQVNIDPTPPNPVFTIPQSMDTICLPIDLTVTSDDENISTVIFEKKFAPMNRQVVVLPIDQSTHGDYYCGPVAAAIAIKHWFDAGYIYGMREGSQYIPYDTVVERMASLMLTRRYQGTYDDLFYYGLRQYILTHGNELLIDAYWNPDYADFRTLFQEREQLVILGLGGSPGLYLVAGAVNGLADEQGRYAIRAADPISASIIDTYIRNNGGGAEVYYDGDWHSLDIIFTVVGNAVTITRDYIGSGSAAGNLWSYAWTSSDMIEDSTYFISATADDASGRSELTTSFVLNKCELYLKGDYDASGAVNIGDAIYLNDFIFKNGPAPVGGAGRADVNCDGNIDIGDISAIILYIYGMGPEPCY
jgi:hypothetical protein